MSSYATKNMNRGEEIIKEAEKNPFFLIKSWIIGILFFWLLLIPLVKAIRATIAYVNSELVVTNRRVIGKSGFINSGALDAPLNKIQNVSVSSGFWGKCFNFGEIHIDTASGKYKWGAVKNAEAFKGILMNQIEEYENDRAKKQAEEMAKAMAATMKQQG